jgi:hypothetical protein
MIALPDGYQGNVTGMTRIVTPQADRYVSAVIATKLLDRGLVIKDNHGVLNAESLTELEKLMAEYGMCDFCSSPEAPHTLVIPDFEMTDAVGTKVGDSTGGWACCDTCLAMVKADQRPELLARSQELLGGGNKYGAGAIKILHKQFWTVWDQIAEASGVSAAVTDFINDTLPTMPTPDFTQKDRRIAAIQRLTGMTGQEMAALMKGDLAYQHVSQKLVAWKKRFGNVEARRLIEYVMRPEIPSPPGTSPHWQIALDMKHDVMKRLHENVGAQRQMMHFTDSVDMKDPKAVKEMVKRAEGVRELQQLGYEDDLRHLKLAATYSFNAETMDAIRLGAHSIPHESPLASIDTPYQTAGFFWFAEPFPVTSSPIINDATNALLWGWEQGDDQPILRMTTFVMDGGRLAPSTKWFWPRNLTFHEMIGVNTVAHRRMYGAGGAYEHLPYLVGEETTMKCVSEMSLFFLMACVWFKQKVLVSAPGHVERHARKRYQRDHKLAEPPTVQVIALRQSMKADRDPVDPSQQSEPTRKYDKWRWVVDGHNRLQPCGPGMKDRKLIWIAPFVKGHGDAPLKPKATKVYAVIR